MPMRNNKSMPKNQREAQELIKFLDLEIIKINKIINKNQKRKAMSLVIYNSISIMKDLKNNSLKKDQGGKEIYPNINDAIKVLSVWISNNVK